MPITSVKIHPAIGIARLGDSPNDFFIGPELPGADLSPPGGFKDGNCRMKRQAARFRVFGYDGNTLVGEITSSMATITWNVELANLKAVQANYAGAGNRNATITGAARDALKIKPGPRTLGSPNLLVRFNTGTFTVGGQTHTVDLGEARTDDDGRLIVLGGKGVSRSPSNAGLPETFNNDAWYDDVSDGPIKATVHLNGAASALTAEGAWVIVAPPNYGPHVQTPVTLWDRLYAHWFPAPAKPSYTKDVWPILRRAMELRWVNQLSSSGHSFASAHTFNQATRQGINARLKPAGDMPDLKTLAFYDPLGDQLTSVQLAIMNTWAGPDAGFDNDWVGPPAPATTITPDGLDRAALEACVGACFYPGIESGAFMLDKTNFATPFRIKHTLDAGSATANMALPWQTDFLACGERWWPAARPNQVIPQSGSSYQAWDASIPDGQAMVNDWHTLSLVVRQGDKFVATEQCAVASVVLRTPTLFISAEQGPGGTARTVSVPIVFEVLTPGMPVVLEYAPGSGPLSANLTRLTAGPLTIPATGNTTPADARFWITYTTGVVGAVTTDQAKLRQQGTTKEWTIAIQAVTTARKKTLVGMVLDRSFSMNEDRGDGQPKIKSLVTAATVFVDTMLQDDGVTLVRYNEDAQSILGVTALGDPTNAGDPGRTATKAKIAGVDLTPAGATSIGDGIRTARQTLDATSGYDEKAIVVFTDGKENRAAYIADVSAEIDAKVYAIGLGKPDNISVPALQTLSGNHGGYMLVTGDVAGAKRDVLTKYFLQILAGVSNAQVIVDPAGVIDVWSEHRIPFQVSDADHGLDVILLTPEPRAVAFAVETPLGHVIDLGVAAGNPAVQRVTSDGLAYYRIGLPVAVLHDRLNRAGTWHAVVRMSDEYRRKFLGDVDEGAAWFRAARRMKQQVALPYDVIVHAYSELAVDVDAHQQGFEPGGRFMVQVGATQSGFALDGLAVFGELTDPGGKTRAVRFQEVEPGRFALDAVAGRPGIYSLRVRARGRTLGGVPFEREQTRTIAVWHGGDRDAANQPSSHDLLERCQRERLCRLLDRILDKGGVLDDVVDDLKQAGVDPDELHRCLSELGDKGRDAVASGGNLLTKQLAWLVKKVSP